MPTGIYKHKSCSEITKEKIRLSNLGKKRSEKTRKRIVESLIGRKHTEETREKIKENNVKYWLGRLKSEEHKRRIGKANSGENNYRWIEDRSLLKKDDSNRGGDVAVREWSTNVKERDDWKCKIENQDCDGKLEAHHILRWEDYPELRYELNNGITLCHKHHPRKRAEEIISIQNFRELIVQNI